MTQPEASQGAGSAGMTTYSYVANTVTVTDPAGKWKKSVSDVLGNLVSVIEPNPAGGADYVTDYTYSVFGKLLTATMTRPGYGGGSAVTQTRTWVYNANVQLTSVRHPESSTVANPSTRYAYNADGSILWTKDAKDQRVEFTYDTDGRVTERRRYYANGGEDTCGRVKYFYNTQSFAAGFTQNATGRLAATQTGCAGAGPGEVIEIYSYTAAGAVTKKRLRLVRPGGTVDKDVTYGYGTDGKLATVLYPGATIPYSYTYDAMDRPTKMTGPGYLGGNLIDQVKEVGYGAAGEVTAMKYLQGETPDYDGNQNLIGVPYFLTETRNYNFLYQMTKQRHVGTGGTVAEIEYLYPANSNNGRISQRKNNVSYQVVGYTYDALNRLASAANTGSDAWAQTFSYL